MEAEVLDAEVIDDKEPTSVKAGKSSKTLFDQIKKVQKLQPFY